MFFPRGGSAHVARALARELPAHGCDVTVVSGSLPGLGDADHFYEGCDVHAVRFDRGDAPMHPSYEDRADAPDRVFAALDDDAYEAHVAAWSRALEEAQAPTPTSCTCIPSPRSTRRPRAWRPPSRSSGTCTAPSCSCSSASPRARPRAGSTPRRGGGACAGGRWAASACSCSHTASSSAPSVCWASILAGA